MKFTIGSVLFKKIVDAVKDLVKDTSIEFSSAGMVLNAMDSSHVTLVHMILNQSLSDFFYCDEVISLNTDTLFKILKTCDNDAEICCENVENKLHILASGKGRQMSFSQNLLDLESDTLMVPENMDFPCKIEFPCSEFQKICRDLREFGDDVRMTVSPTCLKLYTASIGEHIEVDYSNSNTIKISSEASLEMSYSLKYLSFFCKACPLSDVVYLFIGIDQPMLVKFPISEDEHLSFYLAPKVDESS